MKRTVLILGVVSIVIALSAGCVHAEPEKLGIEGGYFTCSFPEGWEFVDNDPYYGDEMTYMIEFVGPRAEDAPVLIYVSYYGDGNEDFDGYEDFVRRNTTDIFDEVIAVAEETKVNGKDAITFEYETKEYLNPESKDDTWVMMKEKFYVLFAGDGVGFFVLEYIAPSSVYEEFLPVFQKVADSFEMI